MAAPRLNLFKGRVCRVLCPSQKKKKQMLVYVFLSTFMIFFSSLIVLVFVELWEKVSCEKRWVGISKRKNIPPWSYPDATAAGAAAATSAAASAVCI